MRREYLELAQLLIASTLAAVEAVRRPFFRLFAGIVAAVVVMTACGASGPRRVPVASPPGSEASPGVTARAAVATVTALCEVKREAGRDPSSARAIFEDRAHAELHSLAAAVGDVDASAAGRLLEAKQRLESALAAGKRGRGLVRDADLLLAATIDALAALGLRIRSCPS